MNYVNNYNISPNLLPESINLNRYQSNGETFLSQAILDGNLAFVQQLLAQGASVNQINKRLMTPLAIAVKTENVKMIEVLLNHPRIDIEQPSIYNVTPLLIAVEKNREDIVSLLLAKNANPNCIDLFDNTPLSIAVSKGNEQLVHKLLAFGANVSPFAVSASIVQGNINNVHSMLQKAPWYLSNNLDLNQSTALHLAVLHGQNQIAKYLINANANPYAMNNMLMDPMSIAIDLGNFEVINYYLDSYQGKLNPQYIAHLFLRILSNKRTDFIRLFLEKGLVSPNIIDLQGYSLLQRAVMAVDPGLVNFLLKHAAGLGITLQDATHLQPDSPLHISLLNPATPANMQILDILLRTNPNSIHYKDFAGNFPIHVAASNGIREYLDVLLPVSDINQTNSLGFTPLHQAIFAKQFDTVKYLIQKGANLNVAGTGGCTPLHLAAMYGNAEIIEFLLQNKADPLIATSGEYKTAMHVAVETGQADIVAALIKHTPAITNWDDPDIYGCTPLHTAVKQGNITIASLLLPKSKINTRAINNYTPLCSALFAKNWDMIKLLIEHGVDPKQEISAQINNFIYAVWSNNFDAVNLMLDRSPSLVNMPNSEGSTPLLYSKDKKMSELLIKRGAEPDSVDRSIKHARTAAMENFLCGNFGFGKWLMEQEKFQTTQFIHALKLFNHRFGLAMSIQFKDYELDLKGLDTFATQSEAIKSVKHTTEWIKKAPSKHGWTSGDTDAIIDVMERSLSFRLQNEEHAQMIQEVMANYQNGKIVVIPTSFDVAGGSHAFAMVLYKDILIKCNRWDPTSGIEIFHINDPTKVEQAVTQFITSYAKPENLNFFFKGEIENLLGLQKIKMIKHKSQKEGTCAWTSCAKLTIHAAFYLYLLKRGYNENEAEQYSTAMYKAWVQEDRMNAIVNFAATMPFLKEGLFPPIYDHLATKESKPETQQLLDKIKKLDPQAAVDAAEMEKARQGQPRHPNGKIWETIYYNVNHGMEDLTESIQRVKSSS